MGGASSALSVLELEELVSLLAEKYESLKKELKRMVEHCDFPEAHDNELIPEVEAEGELSSSFYQQLPSSHKDLRQLALPLSEEHEDLHGKLALLFSKPDLACHFVSVSVQVVSAASLQAQGLQLVNRIFFQAFDMNLFWVFYSFVNPQGGFIYSLQAISGDGRNDSIYQLNAFYHLESLVIVPTLAQIFYIGASTDNYLMFQAAPTSEPEKTKLIFEQECQGCTSVKLVACADEDKEIICILIPNGEHSIVVFYFYVKKQLEFESCPGFPHLDDGVQLYMCKLKKEGGFMVSAASPQPDGRGFGRRLFHIGLDKCVTEMEPLQATERTRVLHPFVNVETGLAWEFISNCLAESKLKGSSKNLHWRLRSLSDANGFLPLAQVCPKKYLARILIA